MRCRHGRNMYFGASLAVIALGLLSRSSVLPLSPFWKKYSADALWALLVFLLIRFALPRLSTFKSAVIAFAIAVAVEASQLYHAPWIDGLRATRLGALTLGSWFNWPDMVAYAVGVAVGGILDRCAHRQPRNP
jgi:hypothetical protein